LWTFFPEGQIPIIDPPAIDLSELSPIPFEDGCFGRDAHMRKMDQGMPRIEQCGLTDCKFAIVSCDCASRILGVWKHPPDADSSGRELAIQPRDLRHITVGDGAIGCGKDEHHDSNARTCKLTDGLALKIEPIFTDGMRRLTSRYQKEEQKRELDKKIPGNRYNDSFGPAHDIAPILIVRRSAAPDSVQAFLEESLKVWNHARRRNPAATCINVTRESPMKEV